MVNYQLAKIYKIECNSTKLVYYGSTIEPSLCRRLAGHRSHYENFKSGKKQKYKEVFEVLKHNNFKISLIENYPCNNKDELSAKKQYYILNNECVNKDNTLGKIETEF